MYVNPWDDHEYEDFLAIEQLEVNMDRYERITGGPVDDEFWWGDYLLRHKDEEWVDKSADGELAWYLVELGYRDYDDWWDVGDTGKVA